LAGRFDLTKASTAFTAALLIFEREAFEGDFVEEPFDKRLPTFFIEKLPSDGQRILKIPDLVVRLGVPAVILGGLQDAVVTIVVDELVFGHGYLKCFQAASG
jgi:hypothetical protein